MNLISQYKATFLIYWWSAAILLVPLLILVIRWSASLKNIYALNSVQGTVFQQKIRAAIYSTVMGFAALYLFFWIFNGIIYFVQLIAEGVSIIETINPLNFFLIWTFSFMLSLSLELIKGKVVAVKHTFYAFLYSLLSMFFSIGILVSYKLGKFPVNPHFIVALVMVSIIRYDLYRKGL